MTLRRAYRGLTVLLVGIFLVFQISAATHAASYGDAPHEHEGSICVIATLAEDDQGILPIAPEHIAESVSVECKWQKSFTSAAVVANQSRAPPPRGPPLFIQ
ncbi:MAG: hypothetical protein EX271_06595 [Acidimicrobiales bacterium]|nr:hypothetical protein [Hyphomonadaceae bacterium]RZV42123.1 MAG: hypothetical protein EX271_06595 [Acidimicrobiales bacterium]